jgi:hypothetical protein
MDEQITMLKARQREKVNSIAVTADNKASLRVNQHMLSNISTPQ